MRWWAAVYGLTAAGFVYLTWPLWAEIRSAIHLFG